MRIIFSGGGTGGHIYPALAIREILLSKFSFESGYVGIKGGMEDKIVSREKDIEFMGVRAQGMPRTISPKWFTFPFVNAVMKPSMSLGKCLATLAEYCPYQI